ncbi:MAG: hypothetical protein QY326_01640 [Bdellovibrionota bacterium]|nr:MAG: hypothetical protein QY326_01640 [Bdellovibrionota bacterium]
MCAAPAVFGMVTTQGSHAYTGPALESFFRATPLSPEDSLLLIDNDNSWPSSLLPSQVELVRNASPAGFAQNMNLVLRTAAQRQVDAYLLNNDVIFAPGWRSALEAAGDRIAVPLSNREVQYAVSVINLKTNAALAALGCGMPSTLADYQAFPEGFAAIAAAHARAAQGFWPVYVAPYYCVRIPRRAIEQIGLLDEAFGRGGGEDYDYSLRALLAGISTCFVLGAYLLHFGGKSSWDGAETTEEQAAREAQFFAHFRAKWGEPLFQYICRENSTLATQIFPDLKSREESGALADIVRALMPPGSKQG